MIVFIVATALVLVIWRVRRGRRQIDADAVWSQLLGRSMQRRGRYNQGRTKGRWL